MKNEDEIKTEQQEQRSEIKTKKDGRAHYGHKRRYDESHGYSYYEHREDRRWIFHSAFDLILTAYFI